MTNITTTDRSGAVAVIRFGTAPVNSLGKETRRALTAAIDTAIADASVAAIVLVGENGLF